MEERWIEEGEVWVVRDHREAGRGMRDIDDPVVRARAVAQPTERLVKGPHLCVDVAARSREPREIWRRGRLPTQASASRRRWVRIRQRVVLDGLLRANVGAEARGIGMRARRTEGERDETVVRFLLDGLRKLELLQAADCE